MKSILKHSFWLAPLVTFVGFVSYYLFFARFPAVRDVPWVNVPWVLIGALLGVAGMVAAWKQAGWGRRVMHVFGTMISVALAALLCFYVSYVSYQMPSLSETTDGLGKAPDFTLSDAHGEMVSLSDFRGKKVVISFYRGFW